jgi:alcohol dehydrogenase
MGSSARLCARVHGDYDLFAPMPAFFGEFTLTPIEQVISGPGVVAGMLGDALDRRRCGRAVVVTGRTLAGSPLLTGIEHALGDRLASVFTGVRQHVPAQTVAALVDEMRRLDADAVISFGGGSPIDTAKMAVHALLTHADREETRASSPAIHFAIPTTLSAGEFTSVAGITDEVTRVKRAVVDPRLAPRVVFTDPILALDTPAWLWAASGIRALDHAIESSYSSRHHPLSDALAAKAIRLLVEHLPASILCTGPERVDHRGHCQIAAWLSVFGITNAGFGLSHAFGHQIGPRWNVPHGITSCITLPHVMRFMADHVPERFAPIAEGFGVPFDGDAPRPAALECADRLTDFIAQFDLPQRLSSVDVPLEHIDDLAGVVHEMLGHAHDRELAVTREALASVLRAAY